MSLDVSAGGAFIAGLLSFFSPCVLPLVPPYLAYMGGVSIAELRGDGVSTARGRVLLSAASFVAGFSTVFVALGATASWIGQAVGSYLGYLSYAAGVLIVIMGLHFLGVFRIGFLDRTARVGVAQKPAGLAGAYVIGLAFGFGWSPCVGPVLTAILLMAGASDSAGEGARLLLIYSLGIGVPFVVAAGFAGAFMRWSASMRARLGVIEKVMGGFLVVAGILIFTGQMPAIAFWMIETFPVLGKLG
ncbi:MAG: cytochrome c biogenesis protein CcdA [Pseudolabrys sp.]|uniref:cytochrome c biogenesis CcdA family protein n=1 Tax=Phenylobacterium sp. TaxID=1871053 RepID=UPI002720CA16|nr:cytochrome c biogenesis protein CcdA [Phenylobacterium sp.]MDO8910952.1 cytochrome c biogenesis protein CcdA [Phenylobacterium sp.]MDP2297567.1 cytochrome c biogenesis protein CcdA [Pseudolabrys sp.]